jgi:hypothetical protein
MMGITGYLAHVRNNHCPHVMGAPLYPPVDVTPSENIISSPSTRANLRRRTLLTMARTQDELRQMNMIDPVFQAVSSQFQHLLILAKHVREL